MPTNYDSNYFHYTRKRFDYILDIKEYTFTHNGVTKTLTENCVKNYLRIPREIDPMYPTYGLNLDITEDAEDAYVLITEVLPPSYFNNYADLPDIVDEIKNPKGLWMYTGKNPAGRIPGMGNTPKYLYSQTFGTASNIVYKGCGEIRLFDWKYHCLGPCGNIIEGQNNCGAGSGGYYTCIWGLDGGEKINIGYIKDHVFVTYKLGGISRKIYTNPSGIAADMYVYSSNTHYLNEYYYELSTGGLSPQYSDWNSPVAGLIPANIDELGIPRSLTLEQIKSHIGYIGEVKYIMCEIYSGDGTPCEYTFMDDYLIPDIVSIYLYGVKREYGPDGNPSLLEDGKNPVDSSTNSGNTINDFSLSYDSVISQAPSSWNKYSPYMVTSMMLPTFEKEKKLKDLNKMKIKDIYKLYKREDNFNIKNYYNYISKLREHLRSLGYETQDYVNLNFENIRSVEAKLPEDTSTNVTTDDKDTENATNYDKVNAIIEDWNKILEEYENYIHENLYNTMNEYITDKNLINDNINTLVSYYVDFLKNNSFFYPKNIYNIVTNNCKYSMKYNKKLNRHDFIKAFFLNTYCMHIYSANTELGIFLTNNWESIVKDNDSRGVPKSQIFFNKFLNYHVDFSNDKDFFAKKLSELTVKMIGKSLKIGNHGLYYSGAL